MALELLANPTVAAAIVAACAAIITAIIGAVSSLRAKIQETAWKHAYEQKRSDILALNEALNRFGELVNGLGEIRGITGPFGFQLNCITLWVEQLWPDGKSAQRVERSMKVSLEGVPFRLTVEPPNRAETEALQRIRTAIGNEVTQEALSLAHHVATLQGRLLLTVRYPNVVAHAVAAMMAEFSVLVGIGKGAEAFAFEGFSTRYSRALRAPRIALGRELRRSGKSLRAVHAAPSPLYRFINFLRNPVGRVRDWWKTYFVSPEMFRNLHGRRRD